MSEREYEITAIMNEKSVESCKEAIDRILNKHSVSVVNHEDLGRKNLWHPILHNDFGHFSLIKCKINPSLVKKIEEEMRIESSMLRFSIIRTNG